jgi:hypothetical protein
MGYMEMRKIQKSIDMISKVYEHLESLKFKSFFEKLKKSTNLLKIIKSINRFLGKINALDY